MHRLHVTLLSLGLLLFTSSACADLNKETLKQLVETGKSGEAYALASKYLEQWEGDPFFDLYYGIAAVDAGHPDEGIFSLRRVVMLQPNNLRARLELGRAYFIRGEDVRAKEEFDRVLAADPPKEVVKNIQPFIAAIKARSYRYKRVIDAYIELGMGSDSNINSAPSDDSLSFTNFTLKLSSDAQKKSDTFSQLSLGGSLEEPLFINTRLFAQFDGKLRSYVTESSYDNATLTAQTGIAWDTDTNHLKWGVMAQNYRLDYQDYRNLVGSFLSWGINVTAATRLGLSGSYSQLFYETQPFHDSQLTTYSVNAVHAIDSRGKTLLFASAFYGKEEALRNLQAARRVTDRNFYGTKVGVQHNSSKLLTVTGSLTGQTARYDNKDILFNERREELYMVASLSAQYAISDSWSIKGDTSYARNESSIDLYDYNRWQALLSIRYDY